jgi:DNA-binding NarL/FixJ family response regulator
VVSILVADEHEVVRVGVQAIIASRPGWDMVASAANAREAIERATATRPDVAIIDYALPLTNGIKVTRQIRSRLPDTEVLAFTNYDSEAVVSDFIEAGARGYVLKSDPIRTLIAAVEALASRKPFFTPDIAQVVVPGLKKTSRAEISVLSSRERDVVRLIAEGLSTKAIARLLILSPKTVETHRTSSFRKLNASTLADLVRYAIRNKLIEP